MISKDACEKTYPKKRRRLAWHQPHKGIWKKTSAPETGLNPRDKCCVCTQHIGFFSCYFFILLFTAQRLPPHDLQIIKYNKIDFKILKTLPRGGSTSQEAHANSSLITHQCKDSNDGAWWASRGREFHYRKVLPRPLSSQTSLCSRAQCVSRLVTEETALKYPGPKSLRALSVKNPVL